MQFKLSPNTRSTSVSQENREQDLFGKAVWQGDRRYAN